MTKEDEKLVSEQEERLRRIEEALIELKESRAKKQEELVLDTPTVPAPPPFVPVEGTDYEVFYDNAITEVRIIPIEDANGTRVRIIPTRVDGGQQPSEFSLKLPLLKAIELAIDKVSQLPRGGGLRRAYDVNTEPQGKAEIGRIRERGRKMMDRR